jgi:cytochrome P450
LHRSLARLSNRYGPLVYLRLGSVHTAVVSSPELAMQCLCGPLDETFASRPSVCIFRHLFYGQDVSIGFGKYGPKWRDLRKLCILHALRPHKVRQFTYESQPFTSFCIVVFTPWGRAFFFCGLVHL